MKILYTILYFAKYIIFGNRRGYDTRSKEFSMNRIFIFIVLVFLIVANVVLAKHASLLSKELKDNQDKLQFCEVRCKK